MWAAPGDGLNMKTLWTDTPYATQRVAGLFEARQIDATERDDLTHFIEHGWVLWPGAIEPELTDRLSADVRGLHRYPGKFLTTDRRGDGSSRKLSGRAPDRLESLFDLYVNLGSAREVCLHPRIARFLSLVFDTRPVACRQVLLQRSDRQRAHQDTALVGIEDPMLLAATWIALEDVIEGSGEFAFYDKSHRLPHFLFSDGSKRINLEADDNEVYAAELAAACRRERMSYQRLHAKRGDVFVWTADLVHRSHPRTLPDETSRMSCVTHYHANTTAPLWFRRHPERAHLVDYAERGAYVSEHYGLVARQEGMLTPEGLLSR